MGYLNFTDILKQKIPFMPLAIHLAIIKNVYTPCTDTPDKLTAFIIYSIIISILTIVWEAVHAYFQFIKYYKSNKRLDTIIYVSLSTVISFWCFLVLCYYLQDGKPLSCFVKYNEIVAQILMYLTAGIVSLYSYVESKFWTKLDEFTSDQWSLHHSAL